MDIEKIADFDHEGEEWFMVDSPDYPEFVELPDKGVRSTRKRSTHDEYCNYYNADKIISL